MPIQIFQYSNLNDFSHGMNGRKCLVVYSYAVNVSLFTLALLQEPQ